MQPISISVFHSLLRLQTLDGEYVFGFWLNSGERNLFDDFSIGEEGAVSGIVTDGTNPIEGAEISIDGAGFKVTTDTTGAYSIVHVLGTHTLRVKKSGYNTDTEEVAILLNTEVTQNFTLLPQTPKETPYTMGFENEEDYHQWLIVDVGSPTSTWQRLSSVEANSGLFCMYAAGIKYGDWLFTPTINLTANVEYLIDFYTRCQAVAYAGQLSLFVGNAQTIESMSTEPLWEATVNWNSNQLTHLTFTPDADGEYVFGWKVVMTSSAMQLHLIAQPHTYYTHSETSRCRECNGNHLQQHGRDHPYF